MGHGVRERRLFPLAFRMCQPQNRLPVFSCEAAGAGSVDPRMVKQTTGALMAAKSSIWQRIVQFFRPKAETYETRRNRPGVQADTPNSHFNEPTDQRRAGWGAGG